VNNPPVEGPNSGDDEYVEVYINSNLAATFMKLIYSGPLEVAARAVARCWQETVPLGAGNAIITLQPTEQYAFEVGGSANVIVTGGGVYANSSANKAMAVRSGGQASASYFSVVGNYHESGGGVFTPTPVEGVPVIADPLASLPPPPLPPGTCATVSVGGGDNDTIDPGLYCSISVSANGLLTMNPGIYYIEGDFSVSGGGELVANQVMIYMEEGDFDVGGGGDIQITAPVSGQYQGMAIFMDQSNSGTIEVSGNGSVNLTGTIYGATAFLDLSGSGSTIVLNSQIIVDKLKASGSFDLAVNYDPDQVYGGEGGVFIELAE